MHDSSNALAKSVAHNRERHAKASEHVAILTDIYQEDVNMTVWQQQLSPSLVDSVNALMAEDNKVKAVMTVTPQNASTSLLEHSTTLKKHEELCLYIGLLTDMFCTLFDINRVGLRLTQLDRAMCPKFHVDRVPCRLITTFSGLATQWLPNEKVDRNKLGARSLGLPDEESGIMRTPADISQLNAGDVALLKGESWYNNEGGGLVHRSPALTDGQQRLILTLDFID